MTGYRSLGIRPIINAYATLTRLGVSLMPPEVLQAMHEAAGCFVDLPELQRRVGERLAELTHNEAAYVSSGAAAGRWRVSRATTRATATGTGQAASRAWPPSRGCCPSG
jgi:L-seryl-tRNA(Ser) seleniumtransferase